MAGISKRRHGLMPVTVLAGAALALFGLAASDTGAATVSGGGGATATETQNIRAKVNSEVSWGSANSCVQNMGTNDFGLLTPSPTAATLGSFDALPHASASTDSGGNFVWVGCVTSNTTLASVTAAGTADMASATDTLPVADVNIGVTNQPGGQAPTSCAITANASPSDGCSLPNNGTSSQTLVTEAPEGTTELDWQYQLNLPANQPVGSYTGGQVTFTATTAASGGGGGGNPS
jgi:hypothetical protein